MNLRLLRERLEEAMKGAQWRMLTDAEIRDEWKWEYSLEMLFDTKRDHMGPYAADGEALIKYVKSAKVRDVTHDVIKDIYQADSLAELIQRHKHMGKDIQGIKDAMDAGKSLPYPLVLKKSNGELEALGGRHRITVARLFGYGVKALILDEDEIRAQTKERMKEAFLDGSLIKAGQDDPHWKARRKEIVKWVEAGAHGKPPRLTHWTEAEGVRLFAWFVTGRNFDTSTGWSDDD
jgi:hypothetical protein